MRAAETKRARSEFAIAHPSPRPTTGRRRAARVPLLTQVEAQGANISALGRTSDISVGGLLIETPDTLSEGTTVVIRFFLPPQRHPMEAAGRVVRVEPGRSMAIAFLGLPESHREKIVEYVRNLQGRPAEKLWLQPQPSSPRQRRSGRLPRRISVVLSWQDEEGRPHQETAETRFLSRYGAFLLSFSELQPGQLVRMTVPEIGKEGLSRVVWSTAAEVPGRTGVGVEVIGVEDFWGVEFPDDQTEAVEAPKLARRRSARYPRRIDVVLNWVDELGRVREEYGQTKSLSKYGASVSSLVALPVKQRFRLRAPEMGREAESRVVWARPGDFPGRTDLGVEFLDCENFWGLSFPPDPGAPVN